MIFRITTTAAVLVLALGACSHSGFKESACGGKLANFDHKMESLALGLRPWARESASFAKLDEGTRAPASVQAATPSGSGELLSTRDRESWMRLSREILDEVQSYLDPAMDDSRLAPVRHKVSRLADHVVALHGYALSGRTERMQEEIAEVRLANSDLRAELCK